MALRKMPNCGKSTWRLWRAIRRWKWPIAAVILSITMTYIIYWTGPQPYQSYTFGILPIILTYSILSICFFIIVAGILYELNTKFRIYYICESCNGNFVFEGKKNPDVRCPSCSSSKLYAAEIIPLKEYPKGLVWNPPKGMEQSLEEKGVDRASYVVGELTELCHHLQQIGIGSMVVWDDPHPEAIHYRLTRGTYGTLEDPLGRIKVEGKVDAVKLRITSELAYGYGKIDQWPYRPPQRPYTRVTYYITYLVYGIVRDLEDRLNAETSPIKAGLFEKKVTGFKWKGGRLADILNADTVLKNILLRIGSPDIMIMPHKEVIASSEGILLVPKVYMEEASYAIQSHEEEQYVEIRTSTIVTDEKNAGRQAFPTLEAFEAYERIARHIRSIISYRP